ncbi:MAG: TIGR01777 family oxidoreductase [Actinomycetota bacterium]|nr:TIGR01777 family oxidoreductase [Actinomycetota bacterium]
MRVAVTGSSGLIGTALIAQLRLDGHSVSRLVRRGATSPDEISWNPVAGTVDLTALEGIEVVFHLAGAGVGDHRWTDAYKAEILNSRVQGTQTIAHAMTELDSPPHVLISGSAIGWYGDTAGAVVDERAPAGSGFLADVVQAWEAATAPASEAGIRVVHARTGLVVAREGGAWARMFPLFRLGIGGKLGPGSQYWSWISLRDEISALIFCMNNTALSGAVNLTGPEAATNAEVTAAMGRVMGRPTVLPVPSLALKVALGEFSSEVLGSIRVIPAVLRAEHFSWADTTIESAISTAWRSS